MGQIKKRAARLNKEKGLAAERLDDEVVSIVAETH